MSDKNESSSVNFTLDESLEGLRLLGARICRRRIKLGLSQRDLVNDKYYERLLNDVEGGKVAPSTNYLLYLAESLATSPEELLEISPSEPTATDVFSKYPELDLALTNAQFKIEIEQPGQALSFLKPYEASPESLPSVFQPIFYRLRGHARLMLRNFKEAEEDLAEAFRLLDLAEPVEILQREIVRNLIGLSHHRQNRVNEAIKTHRQSLEVVLQYNISSKQFRLKLYTNLAIEYYLLGKFDIALKVYKNDALPLAELVEDDSKAAQICWGIGLVYKALKEYGQAVVYLDRSVKLLLKHDNFVLAAQALDQLGLTFVERGDYKLAEETLFRALQMNESLNQRRSEGIIYSNIAYLYQKNGQLEQARIYINRAIDIMCEISDTLQLGQAMVTQAEIKLLTGETEAAFEDYEEAARILEQTDQKYIIEKSLELYADSLKNMGQFDKALEIRFRMADFV